MLHSLFENFSLFYFCFSEYYLTVFIVFLSSHGFYSLSHQPTFSSIPWQAAFIGVPGNFAIQLVPAALVVIHIFASQILTSVALPMLVMQQNYRQSGLSKWTYKLILLHSLKVNCNINSRKHLAIKRKVSWTSVFFFFEFCFSILPCFTSNHLIWRNDQSTLIIKINLKKIKIEVKINWSRCNECYVS